MHRIPFLPNLQPLEHRTVPSGPDSLQGHCSSNYSDTGEIVVGLDAVAALAKEHGIPRVHLAALIELADAGNLAFGIRGVNPFSTSLILAGLPTKGLAIKGKTADWGPAAGYIPVRQEFSKLCGQPREKINAADQAVKDCIKNRDAVATQLALTTKRLLELVHLGAIEVQGSIGIAEELRITARSKGVDGTPGAIHVFDARMQPGVHPPAYEIFSEGQPFEVLGKKVLSKDEADADISPTGTTMDSGTVVPVTADYDVLFFAPHLSEYGSRDRTPVGGTRSRRESALSRATWETNDSDSRGRQLDRQSDRRGSALPLSSSAASRRRSSIRFDDDEGQSDASTGLISQRLRGKLAALNRAVGRDQYNPLFHHGAETANPNAMTSDAAPAVFFFPRHVAETGGVVYAPILDAVHHALQLAKDAGFQYFPNPRWEGELQSARLLRQSFREQQRYWQSMERVRAAEKMTALEPHVPVLKPALDGALGRRRLHQAEAGPAAAADTLLRDDDLRNVGAWASPEFTGDIDDERVTG